MYYKYNVKSPDINTGFIFQFRPESTRQTHIDKLPFTLNIILKYIQR